MSHKKILVVLSILAVMLSLGVLTPASPAALAAAPAAAVNTAGLHAGVTDVPDALVASGVTRYTLAAPKVFWYAGVPICPPPDAPAAPEQT